MARTPTLFDPDVPRGVAGRFVAGAGAAFAGVPVALSDRRLLLWSLVPMMIHVALFAGLLLWLTGSVAPDVAAAAAGALNHATGLDAVSGDTWKQLLVAVVHAGVVVLGVIVAFIGSIFAASVVCDPFFDVLSERTEEVFLGRVVGVPLSVRSVVVGILRELQASVLRFTVWAIVAVPLWLLSFTFLGFVTGPLSMLWTWLFSALEFVSRSLARHAVHRTARLRAVFAHKAFFLGFGAAAALLSLVPFSSPFLVIGATRAYLALAARGRVASRLTDGDRAHLVAIIEKKASPA